MARTEKQNEIIREQSILNIKAAALRLFSRNGIGATRIQDIAKEAEISTGLMYRYYSSKEDIYYELIKESMMKLIEATNYLLKLEMSSKEKIYFALEQLYLGIQKDDTFRTRSLFIQQAISTTTFASKEYEELQKLRDEPYFKMAEIFKQGQEEGTIIDGDPYFLATLFWSNITGLAIYFATRGDQQFQLDHKPVYLMFIKERKV